MSGPRLRWGTVTAVAPLRVRFDGDATALPFEPESLIDPLQLTISTRVRCEVTSRRVLIVGALGGDPRIAPLVETMPSALALGRRNLLRNARFRVNPRAASSGATVADGAYFLDGWKNSSGTSTNLITWSGSDVAGRVLTIGNSGNQRAVRQVIERADVVAGDYVLGQFGTALMRAYKSGDSAPAYAAGPVFVTLDGSGDVIVEFQNASGASATVDRPYLVRAEVWSGHFPDISYAEDLAWCQRFYYRTPASTAAAHVFSGVGFYASSTGFLCPVPLPVPMRAVPTLGTSALGSGNFVVRSGSGNDRAVSAIALQTNQVAGTPMVILSITTATDTSGQPGVLRSTTSGQYLEFSTEL